ncbi:transposase [Mangrovicoccus sp. HB161399]|uniref:transposase n=1 Tax=Mangrovicoccus sp. HB161399 TaxID=2720392 RepID=UPI00352D8CB4
MVHPQCAKSGRIPVDRRTAECLESGRHRHQASASRRAAWPGLVDGRCGAQIGISQHAFCRWRKRHGGMNRTRLPRLKELEKENPRLRRAVSDLTPGKLILAEAARGNFRALRAAASARSMCARRSAPPSAGPVGCPASLAPRSASRHRAGKMRRG